MPLNKSASATQKALLAQIHMAQKALGMDEDTYRAVLMRVIGARSCAGVSARDLERVVDELKRLGWRPAPRKTAFRPSDKPYVRKVWALWGALGRAGKLEHPTRQGLRAFVKRQTGKDDPEWLTPSDANKVIEGVKKIEERLPLR